MRAKIQEDLLAARDRLTEALAEMARRLDWARAKPEELGVELITQPTITVPPEKGRTETLAPAWLRRFPSLLESRMRRRFLAQLEGPLARAYATFSGQLRSWQTAALAALASQFTAQAEPMRVQARRAAEGGGAGDVAGIAADLAQIEGTPQTVTVSSGGEGRSLPPVPKPRRDVS